MADFAIRGRRVFADGALAPRSLHVYDETITAVAGFDELPDGIAVVDAGDAIVMPGLVDTHVHVNEPGRTPWEGYDTATRAAAAGGVTTLVDMPLNSIPPTTSRDGLRQKRDAATDQCWVDVGFWGGVVPGNAAELEPLARGGVLGYKCFLVESGVDEFPHVVEKDLRIALPRLRDLARPLLVHAELPGPIARAEAAARAGDPRRYSTYLSSRPREAEDAAIDLLIRLSRITGAAVHIVHHASADAIELLARARDEGLPITAETCPHYLHFAAEDIPDGATQFKCAPPIREAENRERLWDALDRRVLDMVVSDHSPCTPDLKCFDAGSFTEAWGGIASLQLGLPAMWSELRARGTGAADDAAIGRLVEWMCAAPARLAGLAGRKGIFAAGADADVVIWDPDLVFTVRAADLAHRNPVTPYDGETLRGAVLTTYVRGYKVYDRGRYAAAPAGALLTAP
jgi:allantoinase